MGVASISASGPGLRARLRRLSDGLDAAVIAICAAMLAAMLAVSAVGILCEAGLALNARLGRPDPAPDSLIALVYAGTRPPLVRLFLPWLGMLSVTVAFKRGEHVAIGLLVENLPAPLRRAAQAVNLAAIGLFGAALVYWGLDFTLGANQALILSDRMQLPFAWSAASVPAAGLVLCVHLAHGLTLVEAQASDAEDAP